MRRLPPNKIEQSLSGLLNLIPAETDELLQRVDQPLEEAVDSESVREFISSIVTCADLFFDIRDESIYCVTTIGMETHTGNICEKRCCIPNHLYVVFKISLVQQIFPRNG